MSAAKMEEAITIHDFPRPGGYDGKEDKNMATIKSGDTVKLETLIKGGQVNDKTWITIYDKDKKFGVRGHWFEDKVLEHSEAFGKVFIKPHNSLLFILT